MAGVEDSIHESLWNICRKRWNYKKRCREKNKTVGYLIFEKGVREFGLYCSFSHALASSLIANPRTKKKYSANTFLL